MSKGEPHTIDHRIGKHGGNQFPSQAMGQQILAVGFHQLAGEVVEDVLIEERIVRHIGGQHGIEQGVLGVGQQHRQFRPGQPLAPGAPLAESFVIRQVFHRPGKHALALQGAQVVGVFVETTGRIEFQQAEGQGLHIVVAQHGAGHIIGHPFQQRIPGFPIQTTIAQPLVKWNLDVHFPVGAVHAAGVVDGVRVDTAAVQCVFDAAQLGQPQVAALAHHLAAQVAAVNPDGIIGPVPHLGLAFIAAFHIGADAAVPEQLHRRLENGSNQFCRGQGPLFDPQGLTGLRAQGDALGAARPDAPPFGNQRSIEILPGGTAGGEKTLPLGKGGCRVRVRINKDVHVVECGHQLDLFGQQHAVPEHVAAHVANAHHRKGRCLNILARFSKVSLDAFPCATGGDAHLLVVVAGTAAGGKRIPQPEAVFLGQTIGNIRKGRRPLVRRHHQVGIVAIMTDHRFRRHHLVANPVVGDVQQAANEFLVTGDAQFLPGLPVRRVAALEDESALGPHRHDNGVFHHLRFHQAQYLGAEILSPVRPAQPTSGHRTTTQMNPLHLGGIDKGFIHGQRRR